MSKKILFLPVIAYLVLLSCTMPEEPVGPTWNVNIKKIPIIKADTIEVGKELESDNIQPDIDGLLHWTVSGTTEFSVDESLRLEEQEVFEDPPEGLEHLEFDQAYFILRCLNVPFNLDIYINFVTEKEGVKKPHPTKSLFILGGSIEPDSIRVEELFNDLPEKISASGYAAVSGDDTIVTEGTVMQIEYSYDLPLKFSITEVTTMEETEEMDLDEDAREAIEKNLINTSVEGKIINETPISGSVDFYVGVSENNINNLLFSVSLPERGSIGNINVSLNKQKLDYLVEANWYRIFVKVNSVEDVELKSTDCIIIKEVNISGEAKIDIEDLLEENGD